jgi:hypothetical protein
MTCPIHRARRCRWTLTTLAAALAMIGCRTAEWVNESVINPPEGFSAPGAAYYTPPPVAATATVPSTPQVSTAATLATTLGSSPTPSGNTSGNSAVAGRPYTPRDTYDVAVRLPQDDQPVRIVEQASATANAIITNGMRVNDGTLARGWAAPASPSPLAPSPTRVATLRGATLAEPSRTTNSLSTGDGQWRSRSSYESTERR